MREGVGKGGCTSLALFIVRRGHCRTVQAIVRLGRNALHQGGVKCLVNALKSIILACVVAASVWVGAETTGSLWLKRLDDAARPTSAMLEEWRQEVLTAKGEAAQRDVYALPKELMEALDRPGDFKLYRKLSFVPQSVRVAFAESAGEQEFSMADAGGRWESSDVRHNPRLPVRRLSTYAVGSSVCLLFYERGGFAKTAHVVAFRMGALRAEVIWDALVGDDVLTPGALARALEARDLGEAEIK